MQIIISAMIKSLLRMISKFKSSIGAVLNNESIEKMNEEYLLVEGKLQEYNINPNSIVLTLSNIWRREIPNRVEDGLIDSNIPPKYDEGKFIPPSDILDPRRRSSSWEPKHYTEHEHYILHPQFLVVIKSNEIIRIPNGYIGIVSPLTDRLQSGLVIDTETILEPGYRNHLTFSITNRNNYAITLYSGMQIAKIAFIKAEHCSFLKERNKNGK